jgi:hypothetical protein
MYVKAEGLAMAVMQKSSCYLFIEIKKKTVAKNATVSKLKT